MLKLFKTKKCLLGIIRKQNHFIEAISRLGLVIINLYTRKRDLPIDEIDFLTECKEKLTQINETYKQINQKGVIDNEESE